MMLTLRNTLLSLLLCALFTSAAAPGQADKKALLKAMSDRLPTLNDLRAQEKLGETWEGHLAATKSSHLSETVVHDGKKVTIKDLMEAENADRKAMYAIIAKERSTESQKVTADFVGQQSGEDFLKRRARPGDWFLQKNGKWIRKPKRR